MEKVLQLSTAVSAVFKPVHLLTAVAVFAGAAFPLDSFAQSSKSPTSMLCRDATSGAVVTRTRCTAAETRVNPGAPRFAGCYWLVGTPALLDGQLEQVTLREKCSGNDVVLNYSVYHNDDNNGNVSISSTNFTRVAGTSHALPHGVEARVNMRSRSGIEPPIPIGSGITAKLDLLCCPYR